MKIANPLLLIGGLLGVSAVVLGAYSEHKLRGTIDVEAYHSFGIALQYQLFYAIMITTIAISTSIKPAIIGASRLKVAGYMFALGVCMFCFGIEASTLTENIDYKALAPLGGSLLIIAWLMVVTASITLKRKRGL